MKPKIATILFIGAITLFASCKKTTTGPKGDTGAAGTNGTNGINGTNGTNGAQGNANVKIYNYGSTTLTATSDAKFYPSGLTAQKIDSSLIMVYYSADGAQWNVANGLGPNGNYATIQYTDPSPYVCVYLKNADGSYYTGGTVIWQKVRVVIIPTASVFRKANINYNNYNEVANYYNIKD